EQDSRSTHHDTAAHTENSDVSRLARFVAVSVSWSPGATAETLIVNVFAPLAPVVIVFAPRKSLPSPAPEGSQTGFEKSSIRNCVFGSLPLSFPLTLVVPPLVETDVITGAGWRWLPPVSRLIPSPALSRIALPRIESPKVVKPAPGFSTRTPSPLLNAITFRAAVSVPPSVLSFGPSVRRTPTCPFGTAPMPLAFVPTRFPWIRFPLVEPGGVPPSSVSRIPAAVFPETTLPAPAAVPPTVFEAAPRWTAIPVSFGNAAVPLPFVPT